MKIQYTSETPRKIRDYSEVDVKLGPNEVEDIAEIFNTPLSGTYNWDYTIQDNSCLLYTSPSPRDRSSSRMPSSA